jgi:glucose/arabinose dehydrogenase
MVRSASLLFLLVAVACRSRSTARASTPVGCDTDLKLPPGFCATVVADSVGPARDIAVRSNGDLFVGLLKARHETGGVLAVHVHGVGEPDSVVRFGSEPIHGVVLADDTTLYVSGATRIYRYHFSGTALEPRKRIDTIVVGLSASPIPSHTLALDTRGNLIVNIGALSNACQIVEGSPGSPGRDPCPELETSAGIWRFRTDKTNQRLTDGTRIATGLHNALALAVSPRDTMVYAVSHGRDSLHELWPARYDELAGATRAGEEMIRVASNHADFGWPYCYYDVVQNLRVLAPEYGGDGKEQGRCEHLIQPLFPFPAHWAPMAMLFYTGAQFPAKYREGVFVSFHGSALRAPLPEEGYDVVFLPFTESLPVADIEVFADGFAGGITSPSGARHRPVGLAQGKDGSLYVSDDKGGRIWKITYRGR